MLSNLQIQDKYIITGKAGTGKTLMGIAIGLHLLPVLKPYQAILYLTFSKFAKIRIYKEAKFHLKEKNMTKEDFKRIRIENFHSLWWQILKDNWKFLGINQQPLILTNEELINESESQYNTLLEERIISETLLSKKKEYIKKILRRNALPKHIDYCEKNISKFPDVLKKIQLLKINQNLQGKFSHDDSIIWIQKLISKDKNVLTLFNNRYPVIIIDEFQDTDEAQWNTIQKINPQTLIVFGDDEQRIHQYKMRSKDRLQDFMKIYPNYKEAELTILHRFENRPVPIFTEIDMSDYNPSEGSNKIKSRSKYKCLNIVKEERDSSNSIAILCRNAIQVDDIAALFWEKGNFIRKDGSKNSPFENLRSLLIRLINNSSNEKLFDYLRYTKYPSRYSKERFELTLLHEIFPRLSNFETDKHVQVSQNERKSICKEILSLIGSNFPLALKKLKDYFLLIGKSNGGMKYDQTLVNGLSFISRKIRSFGLIKWGQSSQEEKREKIVDFILNYENTILFTGRTEKISIMTVHQAKSRQFDVVIFPWFSTINWEKNIPALKFYVNDGADFYIFLNSNTRVKHKFFVIRTQEFCEELPENYPEFDENELKNLIFEEKEKTDKIKKKKGKLQNRSQKSMDSFF